MNTTFITFSALRPWRGKQLPCPGSNSSTSSWDPHIPRPSRRIVGCYWHSAKKATFSLPWNASPKRGQVEVLVQAGIKSNINRHQSLSKFIIYGDVMVSKFIKVSNGGSWEAPFASWRSFSTLACGGVSRGCALALKIQKCKFTMHSILWHHSILHSLRSLYCLRHFLEWDFLLRLLLLALGMYLYSPFFLAGFMPLERNKWSERFSGTQDMCLVWHGNNPLTVYLHAWLLKNLANWWRFDS